jgi:hypothetical protein
MALNGSDWQILVERIKQGRCTPFIGAGVHRGVLPLASKVAAGWAEEYGYPLEDRDDLARLAQFVAVSKNDKMYPKEKILQLFSKGISNLHRDISAQLAFYTRKQVILPAMH